MAISTTQNAESFFDIEEGVPVNNLYPLFHESEVRVIYGIDALEAVLNVDYEVEISEPDFNQFTITPTASLLTKINDLIAGDVDEINYITVRRTLPLTTSTQPNTIANTTYLSREIDRLWMALIGVTENLQLKIGLPPSQVGDPLTQYYVDPPEEGKAVAWVGNKLVPSFGAADIGQAQDYAEQALAYRNETQLIRDEAEDIIDIGQLNVDQSLALAVAAKEAAEAAAAGMKWRNSVRAATTTTLPACTYANGTGGVGATLTGDANGALSAQDGVTLIANDKLLVKNQASSLQNGVYVVTQVGSAGTPFILTRDIDADSWVELTSQVRIPEEGSTNADTIFICTINQGGTIGITAVTWAGIVLSIADGSIVYAKLAASAIASAADLIAGTPSKLVTAAEFKVANKVLQFVQATPVTTADTSTTILPCDGTIPQNTEGKELITCAITPKNASSILKIEVSISVIGHSGNGWGGALFVDSTANALKAHGAIASNVIPGFAKLVHYVTAGSTSARTYKYRYGPTQGAGSCYANSFTGAAGGGFGGVQETIMTITEILP